MNKDHNIKQTIRETLDNVNNLSITNTVSSIYIKNPKDKLKPTIKESTENSNYISNINSKDSIYVRNNDTTKIILNRSHQSVILNDEIYPIRAATEHPVHENHRVGMFLGE